MEYIRKGGFDVWSINNLGNNRIYMKLGDNNLAEKEMIYFEIEGKTVVGRIEKKIGWDAIVKIDNIFSEGNIQ